MDAYFESNMDLFRTTDFLLEDVALRKIMNMKKIFLFLFAAAALIACSKIEEIGTNPTEEPTAGDEYVTVGLRGVGEYLTAELSPLTKAGSSDLIGIQVYDLDDKTNHVFHEGTSYCYGVYDCLENVSFRLKKDHRYAILADCVVDGQNVINMVSSDVWEIPFNTWDWSPTELNKTYYNTAVFLFQLNGSLVRKGYQRGNSEEEFVEGVDRYFGEIPEYIPTGDGDIEIEMKRQVFGMTFNFTPDDEHQYDHVVITLNNSHYARHTVSINSSGVTKFEIPSIIFPSKKDSLEVPLSIGLEDDFGCFFSGTVTIYRNKMHTIDFKLEGADGIFKTMKGTYETTEMEDYTIVLS